MGYIDSYKPYYMYTNFIVNRQQHVRGKSDKNRFLEFIKKTSILAFDDARNLT